MSRVRASACMVFLFVCTLFTGAAHSEDRPNVAEIVSRIVEAHGGAGALAGAVSSHAMGRIKADFLRDEGSYERWLMRDRRLRVETIYRRSAEYRVLNGKSGYRGTATGPIAEVTDHRYEAMVYQYKQLEMPFGLSKGLYRVEYEGETELGGVRAIVLDVKDDEGPQMKVYVDRDSFLIAKMSGFFSIGGRRAELSAEYADYRKIGGVMLPFRITNYGSGQRIGETNIEQYELNTSMEDTLFMPLRRDGVSK